MKKRLLLVALVVILLLSGCAKKEVDINNLEENYSTIISMPYAMFMGKSLDAVREDLNKRADRAMAVLHFL